MMLIQNVGNKIVSIGTTVLLPGKQMKASDELANSAAIKALVKRNQLKVVKPAATSAQKDATTAKKAVKKRTVKKAVETAEVNLETAVASAEVAREG